MAWNQWVANVKLQKMMRFAYNHLVHGQIMKAWKSWREYITLMHVLKAVAHHKQHLLLACLDKFVLNAQYQVELREKLKVAATFAFGNMLRHSFAKWKKETDLMLRMKWLLGNREVQLKEHAVAKWKEFAVEQKARNLKGALLADMTVTGRSKRMIRYWSMMTRARRLFNNRYAMKAFFTWKVKTYTAGEKRRKMALAVQHLLFGSVKRTFDAWLQYVIQKILYFEKQRAIQEAIRIGDQTIRRKKKELLVAVFTAWKLRRAVFLKIKQHLLDRVDITLQHVIGAWKDHVARREYKAGRMDMAFDFFDRFLKKTYWKQWAASVKEAQEELQEKLKIAASFVFEKSSDLMLRQWALYVKMQKKQRKALQEMVILILKAVDVQRKLHHLRKWKAYRDLRLRKYDKIDRAYGHYTHKKVYDSFMKWYSYSKAMSATAMSTHDHMTLSDARSRRGNRTLMRRMQFMVGNTEVDLGSDDEGQITEGLGSTSAISAARERRERMQPFIELSKSSARKGGAHGFAGGEEDFQTPAASRVGGSSAKQRPPYYSGRR